MKPFTRTARRDAAYALVFWLCLVPAVPAVYAVYAVAWVVLWLVTVIL